MRQFTPQKTIALFITIITITVFASSCKKSAPVDDTNITIDTSGYINGIDTSHNIIKPLGLSITKALPNSVVITTGVNFHTLSNWFVTINGLPAETSQVNITDSSTLHITVPATVTSGKLKIYTPGVTYVSATNFTIERPSYSTINSGHLDHIAVDLAGNIYGDNETSNKVYKITPAGVVSVFATVGTSATQLWGIAADATGNVFVASPTDYKIYKITPAGLVSTFAGNGIQDHLNGTGTATEFEYPTGLAVRLNVNKHDELFVTDNHRVRVIDFAGNVDDLAGSDNEGNINDFEIYATFGYLQDITVDANFTAYVCDGKYLNIRQVVFNTHYVYAYAGDGTAGNNNGLGLHAQFTYPQGLAIDAAGNIFVSDVNVATNTWAIRMINADSYVFNFIGNNESATGANTVHNPKGIAFDASGNMYICNTSAGTITKVTIQ